MVKSGRITNALQFMKGDIWRIRAAELHGPKGLLIRYLRIFIVAGKGFLRDDCILWAASLTYYSLLSIVPVFALAFAIAKGFGFQQHLEELIVEQFVGQEQITTRLLEYSRNLLEDASGGVIAGVGVVFLIWWVFRILETTELSFNNIWCVKKARTMGRKLSDYLSLMLIGPVLLVVSSSALVLFGTQVHTILELIGVVGVISPLITLAIQLVPYIIIWFLFSFMYVFIPNTRVKLSSGIRGGIIAGTIFVVTQWVYLTFQIGVARNNAIYGSLAALPLFLVWLNLSWLIVLFGAELTEAHQNEREYDFEPEAAKISPAFRRLLSLQITHLLVANFRDGGTPLSDSRIAEKLDIPVKTVRQILQSLTESSLIIAVPEEGHKERLSYHPSRDIDVYTVSYVLDALESAGVDTIPVAGTESLKRFSKSLDTFRGLVERSDANVRLKDI